MIIKQAVFDVENIYFNKYRNKDTSEWNAKTKIRKREFMG